jgi:hypothetical protein
MDREDPTDASSSRTFSESGYNTFAPYRKNRSLDYATSSGRQRSWNLGSSSGHVSTDEFWMLCNRLRIELLCCCPSSHLLVNKQNAEAQELEVGTESLDDISKRRLGASWRFDTHLVSPCQSDRHTETRKNAALPPHDSPLQSAMSCAPEPSLFLTASPAVPVFGQPPRLSFPFTSCRSLG